MGLLVDRLNKAYESRASAEVQQAAWYPRPSGLGGCLREASWLLSGLPPEPRTPESMRLLELGSQRGEALERVAKECFPGAEVQVAVQIPTPWGLMPGTVDLWIPELRTIIDFKTAGAYSMGLVVAGEKEDEGYALQLNAYRHGIAFDYHGCRLDPGDILTVLIYEAKDSDARKGVTAGMLHEVEVPYTPELEARYQARLREIALMLDLKSKGELLPELVAGMPKDAKGKENWRCRMKEGRPLYCSIGTVRGKCG